MKVLLTGASGFVGSHILDKLHAGGVPTVILLRSTSRNRFIEGHLGWAEIRTGSLLEPAGLTTALAGVTHVIHCAGCVKAARIADFYDVNQTGTRHLVEAANAQPAVRRFVHLSSLAAAGPGVPSRPVRETDIPHPVSEYGKSKLAGEYEVARRCRAEFVLVRPPAVYGPRDGEFLKLFKAIKAHLLPRPTPQALSLVFVEDLAQAVLKCLDHPAAAGKTYFVACPEVVQARGMAEAIAARMKVSTLPVPLPRAALWAVCLARELHSRLTGKPNMLNLQKFPELRAPGWVCDPRLFQRETGFLCSTTLKPGIDRTLEWYRQQAWI